MGPVLEEKFEGGIFFSEGDRGGFREFPQNVIAGGFPELPCLGRGVKVTVFFQDAVQDTTADGGFPAGQAAGLGMEADSKKGFVDSETRESPSEKTQNHVEIFEAILKGRIICDASEGGKEEQAANEHIIFKFQGCGTEIRKLRDVAGLLENGPLGIDKRGFGFWSLFPGADRFEEMVGVEAVIGIEEDDGVAGGVLQGKIADGANTTVREWVKGDFVSVGAGDGGGVVL